MVKSEPAPHARPPLAAALEAVYREALASLSGGALVERALAVAPPPAGPIRLLALGKAAGPMMAAALAALGPRARDPLCILPEGAQPPEGVRAIHGGHPRPTLGSRVAGEALASWGASGAAAPALVLLSGGGSALAIAPPRGVPPDDKVEALALLMGAGLPIQELNCVRKHLSLTKGGRLAAALSPAPTRVLVLSDVPGNDLSVIASGPLVGDATTWSDVARIIDASGVQGAIPATIRAAVADGLAGRLDETPKPGDPRLDCAAHELLAGPVTLAQVAAGIARRRGVEAEHDPRPLTGTVQAAADRIGAWVSEHVGRGPRLLALGGEPTIALPAGSQDADGGRAQHLALLVARTLEGLPAAVLAAGSDGRDGPTAQAGAVVTGETASFARWSGLELDGALGAFRSGPAAVALGAAIPSFATGTHLGDLVLIVVD